MDVISLLFQKNNGSSTNDSDLRDKKSTPYLREETIFLLLSQIWVICLDITESVYLNIAVNIVLALSMFLTLNKMDNALYSFILLKQL